MEATEINALLQGVPNTALFKTRMPKRKISLALYACAAIFLMGAIHRKQMKIHWPIILTLRSEDTLTLCIFPY